MKRRVLLRYGAVSGLALVTGCIEQVAPTKAAPEQIGFLSGGFLQENLDAFTQGLHQHGWIVGQNITINHRDPGSQIERLPDQADELVALGVRLIVATGPAPTAAVIGADPSMPVVMAGNFEPVRAGLIGSSSSAGSRVTGVVSSVGLVSKRTELLKAVIPSAQRLAFIANLGIATQETRTEIETVAQQLGMAFREFDVRATAEIETAFERASKWPADAAYLQTSNPMANAREQVVSLAARYRLPAIYGGAELVRIGGLIGYGPDLKVIHRRAAAFVDKILKGVNPADLPIERSLAFQLVVNRKALSDLGLTIPPTILPLVTEWVE